jgi:hypothetical protein
LLLEDEAHERILFAIVDDDDDGVVVVVVIVVLDINDISRCAKVDKMEKLFSTFCIIVIAGFRLEFVFFTRNARSVYSQNQPWCIARSRGIFILR